MGPSGGFANVRIAAGGVDAASTTGLDEAAEKPRRSGESQGKLHLGG